ncbi:MAG: tRNA uridine-5-carboxymethylaminomethyl(34) synthesis GTPase MnmE [Candidatus Polarisedimenticolaceae bacterium]|nr:tRNA uridine-5-carboxymethylaminomethyl(34) synthesis GTPase MnmE [Candidatus Polarisedimenticolaceae bacterium]
MASIETIAAIATPPGQGGVGIIRLSGPNSRAIAKSIIGTLPAPRHAHLASFNDASGQLIDTGIALFFPTPHSFTGEDVLELQGHGGPVVMDLLLKSTLDAGARIARPGEFSERAFLNGKLDLVQAEAIADLIESGTASAARLAVRSLQGKFSEKIHQLVESVTNLRIYVEAAIDFPEEEIDFLSDGKVSADLQCIVDELKQVSDSAKTGRLLRDGMTLVIAGLPNAGKSSLLNALAGREAAIVTALPGTTRDLLREQIQIEGMPLHIIDTAGLRESDDPIEQEGVRRARAEIERADRLLWVFDDHIDPDNASIQQATLPQGIPLTLIRNKIDTGSRAPQIVQTAQGVEVSLSAKEGLGIELLQQHLAECVGYNGDVEGEFIARRRHLDALQRAGEHLCIATTALEHEVAGELVAEELRFVQNALSEITGEFSPDDLLGKIFSSFCIGK